MEVLTASYSGSRFIQVGEIGKGMKKAEQYPPKEHKSFINRFPGPFIFLCFVVFVLVNVAVGLIWGEDVMNIVIAVIVAGSIGFGIGWETGKERGKAEERNRNKSSE